MESRNYTPSLVSRVSCVVLTHFLLLTHLTHSVLTENLSDKYENYHGFTSNNVAILKSPQTVGHMRAVTVEYYCKRDYVVVVDILAMFQGANAYTTIFQKAFHCKGQKGDGISKVKKVLIRLPPHLANRPGWFNRITLGMRPTGKVRVWLVEMEDWEERDDDKRTAEQIYYSAIKRDYEVARILPKYSRPFLSPAKRLQSPVWYWDLIQRLPKYADRFSYCEAESDQVTLLNYPAVFSGNSNGINRDMFPYKDPSLEADRRTRALKPKVTIEMWVYFLEFCPLQKQTPTAPSCGLIFHVDRKGLPMTPTLLVNKDGQIQVDAKLVDNKYDSRLTVGKVKKNIWTRIFYTLDARTWQVVVTYHNTSDDEGWNTKFTLGKDTIVDDAWGVWVLGGLEPNLGTFTGYMGRVVYHRSKVLDPDDIPIPDSDHPMFNLHLASRKTTCTNFLKWTDKAVHVYQKYWDYQRLTEGDVCPHSARLMFQPMFKHDQCPIRYPYGLRHQRFIKRLLGRAVESGTHSLSLIEGDLDAYSSGETTTRANYHNISRGLLDHVTKIVKNRGLRQSRLMLKLLKQAACLGNDDAMFELAGMLNNGVGTEIDEIQSLAFFMLGTLNRHMPSAMALGHRHMFGLDGAPRDLDAAYMYFKMVADKCRWERIEHSASEIMTETIRLIDEQKIEAQTSETGELFQWLKMQAEQGITSAQSQLGQMMFHGTQGLNRNLQRALDMFREGAEGGDAEAMFNAGIIEFRGIGGLQANESHGKEMIEKAAELDNHEAIGALAWMAMEHEKNYTKAFEMFHKAKKMGNTNAGFYLGHMWHNKLVPNQTEINLDKALGEYWHSASRGNMDAGVMFALIVSRGTPTRPRDINTAAIWARFIAETHSVTLAKPLRKGLNAYRDGDYALSLYAYLCLASTGLEVASFNVAYLCEHDKEGQTDYITKESQWRNYNLTVQREFRQVDAYSFIKMGDHSWYGCRGKRDLDKAAYFYSQAVLKGDPHALFNLAYMVEEGSPISADVWRTIKIPKAATQSSTSLLLELYSRCKESKKSEAYIPCSLAYARVYVTDIWRQYAIYMKVTSVLGALVVIVSVIFFCINFIKQRRLNPNPNRDVGRRKKEDDEIPDDEPPQEIVEDPII